MKYCSLCQTVVTSSILQSGRSTPWVSQSTSSTPKTFFWSARSMKLLTENSGYIRKFWEAGVVVWLSLVNQA